MSDSYPEMPTENICGSSKQQAREASQQGCRNLTISVVMAAACFSLLASPAYAFPAIIATSIPEILPALIVILVNILSNKRKLRIFALGFSVFLACLLIVPSGAHNSKVMTFGYYARETVIPAALPDAPLPLVQLFDGDVSTLPKADVYKIHDRYELPYSMAGVIAAGDTSAVASYIAKSETGLIYVVSSNHNALRAFLENTPDDLRKQVVVVAKNAYRSINARPAGTPAPKTRIRKLPELQAGIRSSFSKTNAAMRSDYNIILIRTEAPVGRTYMEDALYVDADYLPFYDDAFWTRMAGLISPEKKTIVSVELSSKAAGDEALQTVLSNLPLDEVYRSDLYVDIRNMTWRNDDLIITKAFPKWSEYLEPGVLYQKTSGWDPDGYAILCFSQECARRFASKAITLKPADLFHFGNRLEADLTSLQGLRSKKIVFSPEDEDTSVLAAIAARRMVSAGFDFQGFTYHFGNYFGFADMARGEFSGYAKGTLENYAPVLPDFTAAADAQNISPYLLMAAMLCFGLSCKTRMAYLGAAVCIIAHAGLSLFFQIEAAFENEPLFWVLESTALTGVLAFALSGRIAVAALFATATYIAYAHGLITPWMNYAFNAYAAGMLLSVLAAHVISRSGGKKQKPPARPGEKSARSRRYAPVFNKGRIIRSPEEASRIRLLPGCYILRSNHLTRQEYAEAGVFKSPVFPAEEKIQAIREAFAEARTTLQDDQVQFWLQRHRNYARTGVMQSIGEDIATIDASIGAPAEATGGHAVERLTIHRFDASANNRTATRLLRKMIWLERQEKRPVVVEFGISRTGRIEVLQVRDQHHSLDPETLHPLFSGGYKRLSSHTASRLGSEIIFLITNRQVLISQSGLHRLPEHPRSEEQLRPHDAMIAEILDAVHDPGISRQGTLRATVLEIRRLARPFLTYYLGRHAKSPVMPRSEAEATINAILRCHASFGTPLSYDPCSGSIGTALTLEDFPGQIKTGDLNNMVFMCLLARIRHEIAQRADPESVRMISLSQFDKGQYFSKPNTSEAPDPASPDLAGIWSVIVPGDFSGPKVKLAEFLALDTAARAAHVIRDAFIPVAFMKAALASKAIILTEGSAMSHVVLTAVEAGHPVIIEREQPGPIRKCKFR